MRTASLALLALSLAAPSCRAPSPGAADLPGLAERPPLPCSVLVTGGAFLEPAGAAAGSERPWARTFATSEREALDLAALVQILARGRVFVRVEPDERVQAARHATAIATELAQFDELRQQASAQGHDFLLVLERVDDGPIEAHGVNGQWPITLTTWLLVGLGAVIPDHVYESRAALRATLRDVHDGSAVQELVVATGEVELSLLERTGFWGWVQSILVPPFWVGDDEQRVVEQVRPVVQQRLMVGLAQRLKSVDVADRLARHRPATVKLRRAGANGLALSIAAREPISFLRIRVGDGVLAGADFAAFHHAFLASRTGGDDLLHYSAELPPLPRTSRIQVLVQTISGRVASVTLDLQEAL